MAVKTSFTAEITKHLNKIADVCEDKNPDGKHNVGKQLGLIYFWTMVEKLAKAKKDDAWKYLETEGLIAETDGLDPGDYKLEESPHFFAGAKVSNPVKRFDGDELAGMLNKKYKVPVPTVKEMIEKSKIPGKSSVTKTVIER